MKVFEEENDMARALLQGDNSGKKEGMDWFGRGGKTRDGRIFRSLLQESTGQEMIKVVLGSWKIENKYETYCSEKSTGLID